MKRFYYSLIAICIFTIHSNAQSPTFDWAVPFSGTTDESGRSIAVDANGNVYSTGIFSGTTDFDPGAGTFNLSATGAQDVYVTKLDSVGNFVWAKKIGGVITDNSESIKIDNSGNIYVAGSFNGVCSFDLINFSSAGMGDAFVCKMDPSGTFLWANRFGGSGNDAALAICLDGSGNLYTTGYFSNTSDFDPGAGTVNLISAGGLDIYVSKLDASGNYVAAYQMGGAGFDLGLGIALDGSGNIHTTGYFDGIADFNPGAGVDTLNAGTGEDIYVNKLDASGNFLWAKNMKGTSFNNGGYSLAIDASGNIYSTGYFSGTIDFDPGVGTSSVTSFGNSDSYISKLDALGNFVWVKQIGGAGAEGTYSLALDAGGNIYIAGDFNGTADFDPGAGTSNMTSGILDAYVLKLDASGNFASAIQLTTSNGDPSMSLDNSSNIYITGGFSGTTDFDGGAGTSNLSAVGSVDVYVTKYNAGCLVAVSQPGVITGNTPICVGSNNTYSISPVSGATSYTWTLPGGWTGTSTTTSINATASATSGNILVTANDACGSSVPQSLSVTVSNPTLLFTITNPSCADSCNASIVANGSGGIPIYTYTPLSLTNLCAGIYTVTVTDAIGCTGSSTTTISNPAPLSVIIFASDTVLCDGQSANVSLNGADTYTWNGSSSSPGFSFSPVTSDYGVAVGIDTTTGCMGSDSIYFTVNPLPVVNFTYPGNDTVCVNDGIQVLSGGSPSGGIYAGLGVSGTSFDPNIAGIGVHSIQYTFTDVNTCSASDAVTITVIGCSGLQNQSNIQIKIYPNPFTDAISIKGIDGIEEVKIYNVWGEILYVSKVNETNPVISTFQLLPGVYFIEVRTKSGKQIEKIIKQN